jgi:hypothetical protein
MRTVPQLSKRRALSVGAAGLLIATLAYLPYIIALILIAVASIPPDCGFDAGMDCTNPDANNTAAAVAAVIVSGLFLVGMTLGLRSLIRRAIRPAGALLHGVRGVAMALALAVLPAAVPIAIGVAMGTSADGRAHVFDSRAAVWLILLGVFAGLTLWATVLRRVVTPAPWGGN